MNVEREKRDKLAEMLRHFAAGRLTNAEWISDTPMSRNDRAIYWAWISMWRWYDDVHEHTLTGNHSLPREMRRHIARLILFLYSNLPYEWPERPLVAEIGLRLLFVVTLGRINQVHLKHPDFWPFRREWDFEAAVAAPPKLLGGAR